MAKPYIKITSEPEFAIGKKEITFRFRIPAHGGEPAKWDERQKTGTRKKSEARRIAEEYRKELEEKINAWRKWEKISLGEYARKWHEERKEDIANSSWIKENQQIKQIEQSDLGKIPIDEIEPEDIDEQKKKNKKAKWSEDKQKRFIQKVKQITKDAAKRRTIKHDPGALVKEVKTKKKKRRNPGIRNVAKMALKLENDKKTGYTTALYIAINTGLRRGEILGLQWRDVDLANRTIKIERQLDTKKELQPPKWDSTGEMPMTETLFKWLEEWQRILWRGSKKEDGTEWNGFDPICTNKKGGYIDPNNFERWIRKYFVKVGWGKFDKDGHYQGHKLHELRHYVASELLSTGADLETVRAIMRHKNITTTQQYLHKKDTNINKAMNNLEQERTSFQKYIWEERHTLENLGIQKE